MKIKVEVEVFDDDEYCCEGKNQCFFYEVRHFSRWCGLYMAWLGEQECGDYYRTIKHPKCKKEYQSAMT